MSQAAVLKPQQRERLVRVLGMLGSRFDGERAVAAATADRYVHELGMRWDDVVIPVRLPERTQTRAEEIADLLRRDELFTAWELKFLRSVQHWRGPLSDKQAAVLERLRQKASA